MMGMYIVRVVYATGVSGIYHTRRQSNAESKPL